jgi:uncharacterized protein (TIGR02246 family)
MKHFLPLGGAALLVAGSCFVAADDKPKAADEKPAAKAAAGATIGAAAKAPAKPASKPASAAAVAQPAAQATPAAVPPRSPDEVAIGETSQALAKAFNQRDAKAFAGFFTADGEYIDEAGAVFHGRVAIEKEFTGFLEANPATSIQLQIESTRSVAPGIIAADGSTRFTRAKDEPPVLGHCSLICIKDGNKWQVASLRETQAASAPASHHEELKQLDWLVGEWIDEGSQSHVHFSCRWDEGGNFLLRDFEVHAAGGKTITGTQRIGFDQSNGHLKSWAFDSAGGYAEGYWQQDGDSWILNASGVTADGHLASGSSIFTRIDKNRIAFHSVDRVVGGKRVADVVEVTIVRKPPGPTAKAK